jgi:hypothetical protein
VKTADLSVLPSAVSVGRITGIVPDSEQRADLRAEHERLTMEQMRLRSEFEALRMTTCSQRELREHIRRMRAHLKLLENHMVRLPPE